MCRFPDTGKDTSAVLFVRGICKGCGMYLHHRTIPPSRFFAEHHATSLYTKEASTVTHENGSIICAIRSFYGGRPLVAPTKSGWNLRIETTYKLLINTPKYAVFLRYVRSFRVGATIGRPYKIGVKFAHRDDIQTTHKYA